MDDISKKEPNRRLCLNCGNDRGKHGFVTKKGPHPLTPGCSCIACIKQRKRILTGNPGNWRYHI